MSAGKLNEQAKGVFIIAATPFTDEGALDLQSVDTLTDFYLGCGVHGFTLLGIMGEAPKLTPDESLIGGRSRDPPRPRPPGDRGREPRRAGERAPSVARGHGRGRLGRDGGAAAGPERRRRRLQLLRPALQGARARHSRRLPGLSAEHGSLSRAVGVRAHGRRLQAARHAEARGRARPRQAHARARGREEARPSPRLDPGRQWRPLPAAGDAARRRRRHDGLRLARDAGAGLRAVRRRQDGGGGGPVRHLPAAGAPRAAAGDRARAAQGSAVPSRRHQEPAAARAGFVAHRDRPRRARRT